MPDRKIAVPDEIYERVQEIAPAEGTTVEELATKALERDLARTASDGPRAAAVRLPPV